MWVAITQKLYERVRDYFMLLLTYLHTYIVITSYYRTIIGIHYDLSNDAITFNLELSQKSFHLLETTNIPKHYIRLYANSSSSCAVLEGYIRDEQNTAPFFVYLQLITWNKKSGVSLASDSYSSPIDGHGHLIRDINEAKLNEYKTEALRMFKVVLF